mmetsp:Transcript_34882/g.44484  ORF Transcript_34882/g.44484 Transcript_34882/m.44484 type:complete len:465 (+) Transcript_34882:57-1451(+)
MKGNFAFASTERNELRTPISGRVAQDQRWHGEIKSSFKKQPLSTFKNAQTVRFDIASTGRLDLSTPQGGQIPAESRWHGEPKSAFGKQPLSSRRTGGTLKMSERPEVTPIEPQMHDLGPAAYSVNRETWRSQVGTKLGKDHLEGTGISERSLPIVCQGELKRGRKVAHVSPAMQYPAGQHIAPVSRHRKAETLKFSERPETVPITAQMSNVGPASFNLRNHTTGQNKRGVIRWHPEKVQEPGVSRRAQPVIDQGELKHGRAVTAVAPTQQYPVSPVSNLAANSKHGKAPGMKFASRGEIFPLPVQNNTVGPAGYTIPSTLTMSGLRLPKNMKDDVAARTMRPKTVAFERMSRLHDDNVDTRPQTLSGWLNSQEAQEKIPQVDSLSDWLKVQGQPNRALKKTYHTVRLKHPGRGNVNPTFTPKAAGNVRSKAGQARILKELLDEHHEKKRKEKEVMELEEITPST